MKIVGHSEARKVDGERIWRAEGEERDEKELGGVGVKRREQDLALFEALVVCGEVLGFCFFSSPERQ